VVTTSLGGPLGAPRQSPGEHDGLQVAAAPSCAGELRSVQVEARVGAGAVLAAVLGAWVLRVLLRLWRRGAAAARLATERRGNAALAGPGPCGALRGFPVAPARGTAWAGHPTASWLLASVQAYLSVWLTVLALLVGNGC
jgi:hypothetical protein